MARESSARARLSRTIRVRSVRDGLVGGSTFWLVVLGARFFGRRINKVTKRGEKPIRFSESLGPGETLVVSHIDPRADTERSN